MRRARFHFTALSYGEIPKAVSADHGQAVVAVNGQRARGRARSGRCCAQPGDEEDVAIRADVDAGVGESEISEPCHTDAAAPVLAVVVVGDREAADAGDAVEPRDGPQHAIAGHLDRNLQAIFFCGF